MSLPHLYAFDIPKPSAAKADKSKTCNAGCCTQKTKQQTMQCFLQLQFIPHNRNYMYNYFFFRYQLAVNLSLTHAAPIYRKQV
jgi:hypothetical protein